MTTRIGVSSVDYSSEVTTSTFRGVDLTAANFDAQAALVASLKAAIVAVVINQVFKDQAAIVNEIAKVPPSDEFAQRELKWAISMVDDVLASTSVIEVGGADLANLVAGTEFMDITAGVGLALVAAVEAVHLSPAGNAVTVTSVKFVGRNT